MADRGIGVKCPICSEVMTTDGPHGVICMFNCGHCICSSCMSTLWEAPAICAGVHVVRCPECQQEFAEHQMGPLKLDLDSIYRRVFELQETVDALNRTLSRHKKDHDL